MTERLPFFVYGTLRPGNALDSCWRDLDGQDWADGLAMIFGYRLVYARHRSFPYAIPTGNDSDIVTGALIDVDGLRWRNLLYTLDTVEGYPSHYDRKVVQVHVCYDTFEGPLDPARAWLYTPNPATIHQLRLDTAEPVPNNDWNHRHARI